MKSYLKKINVPWHSQRGMVTWEMASAVKQTNHCHWIVVRLVGVVTA
jgi:hypothetical protein